MSAYLVRVSSAPLGNFFVGQRSKPTTELLGRFRRLIPEKNILPQARRIFSEGQLGQLNSQGQTVLNRLFTLLFSRNVRNIQQFKYALFEDLHLPVTSSPASNSEWIRYTLAEFGCGLAYRLSDGQLVIGTFSEIGEHISSGKLLLLPISPLVRQIPSAPRPTITLVAVDTETTALVSQSKEVGIEKGKAKVKHDLRIELRDLLQKGQAELAAALLFSVIDKPADIIEIVAWAAKDLSVFDQYENSWEALELQCDAPVLQGDIGNDIKLLGYLLGRYSQSAPLLAAGIIRRIAAGILGLIQSRGVALAVDILALVESNEQRANIIQGLTALGEHKRANLIFASAMSEALPLYHDRFGGTLGVLNKRDGEVFLAEEEYEAERKSIYRGAPPATYALEKSRTDRDKHLRDMVDQALEEGNADYAAQAAFAGYSDITARIINISQLRFVKFGQLLANLTPEKRRSVMIDLAFAPKSERSEKAMEDTTLALLWLDGKESIEATAAFLLALLVEESDHPGVRFAVRRLLSSGLSDFITCGNYALVYDELEEMSPEMIRNDCHQFVASDGKLSKDDPPLGRREDQLKHYLTILNDGTKSEEDRIVAARMLGRLHAVEHFKRLARKALGLFRKDWRNPLTLVLMAAVAEISTKVEDEKTTTWFFKLEDIIVGNVSFGLIAGTALIALQTGLNPAQVTELFGKIAKKCEEKTPDALRALPAALQGAKDILSAEQITELFGKIAEKCWPHATPDALKALPAALQGAKDILSPAQITELFGKTKGNIDVALQALPAALQGAKDILSAEQITELFGKIAEKCGQSSIPNVFQALPAALQNVKDILSPVQTVELFGQIAEKCEWTTVFTFPALPAALQAGLNQAQITELFGKIAEMFIGRFDCPPVSFAFQSLPAAFQAGLNPDQIAKLFQNIIEKCTDKSSDTFIALQTALQVAKDILSAAQITELYGKIVKKCGDNTPAVFNDLSAALQAAKDILSPAQITELFGTIAEKGISHIHEAFVWLPVALQGAKDILSPAQITELFEEIVEKCGGYTYSAFYKALPAALHAKLSPAQIIELFGKITENYGPHIDDAFNALPAAFQAGLNPDQIAKLFQNIIEKCTDKSSDTFIALQTALQVANDILSPAQITELFGKVVETCGKWVTPGVFNALPVALQGAKDILSPAQITELLGKLAEKWEHYAPSIFLALPAILQEVKDILSPAQITELLGKISDPKKVAQRLWVDIPAAFKALPEALQGARGILSPTQTTELFGKIAEIRGVYAAADFRALSVALQAVKDILPPTQIIELFSKIAEKRMGGISAVSEALPGIIKEGMSVDQILAEL